MTDAPESTTTDATESRSLWRSIPRGLWIGALAAAVLIAASMWWGVTFDALETARVLEAGGATMQGPIIMALLGLLVPIIIAVFLGAGAGGRFAILAVDAAPRSGFGTRFGKGFLPAIVIAAGAVVAGGAVAALACLAMMATGAGDGWAIGTLIPFTLIALAVALTTTVAGLAIASAVASVMLRPSAG